MSLLLQYGSGWESRCFFLLRHLSCAVVVSTLTLLEITFLVVVLVQSAHVNTMHWQKLFFQTLLVENRDVMREMRCNGSTENRLGDVFALISWRVDLPILT